MANLLKSIGKALSIKNVAKAVSGAAGGFLLGGPQGALVGAIGGLTQKGKLKPLKALGVGALGGAATSLVTGKGYFAEKIVPKVSSLFTKGKALQSALGGQAPAAVGQTVTPSFFEATAGTIGAIGATDMNALLTSQITGQPYDSLVAAQADKSPSFPSTGAVLAIVGGVAAVGLILWLALRK